MFGIRGRNEGSRGKGLVSISMVRQYGSHTRHEGRTGILQTSWVRPEPNRDKAMLEKATERPIALLSASGRRKKR